MSTKTKEQISKNMKAVHNKDSKIELMLRKELWNRGLRYRKNYRGLIGKPDIVFIGKKIAIFAIASFGMDLIGKQKSMRLNRGRSFGFQKLSEQSKETKK